VPHVGVDSTEINAEILLLTLGLWAELTFAWPQMIAKSFDKPCGPTVWIEQIEGLFNIGRVDIPHRTFNGGVFEDSQSFDNTHESKISSKRSRRSTATLLFETFSRSDLPLRRLGGFV